MLNPDPIAEFVLQAWNIHPILTVFLGLVFFPEIEIVFALLILIAAFVR